MESGGGIGSEVLYIAPRMPFLLPGIPIFHPLVGILPEEREASTQPTAGATPSRPWPSDTAEVIYASNTRSRVIKTMVRGRRGTYAAGTKRTAPGWQLAAGDWRGSRSAKLHQRQGSEKAEVVISEDRL